jgi:nucleotide-binding universal stress UspA family protein
MRVLKEILVSTDLSQAGQRAVMRAGQLARQWHANLQVVHARPDRNLYARWRPTLSDRYQDIAREADRQLSELQSRLKTELGVSARWNVRAGRASEVIAAMADQNRPNLIVMGASGEHATAATGGRLGGTVLKLVPRLEQPVLLVRSADHSAYSRSVIAVDSHTSLARRVVLWGTGLVREGESHLVTAYDIAYRERMLLHDRPPAEQESASKQALDGAMALLNDVRGAAEPGPRVELHAVQGQPPEAVLGEMVRHRAQLVALGKHHVESADALSGPLGSVAFRIADLASADVLVIA